MIELEFQHLQLDDGSVLILDGFDFGLQRHQLCHGLLLERLGVGESHPQLLVLGLEELCPNVHLLLLCTTRVATSLRCSIVLPPSLPVCRILLLP